MLEKSKIFIWKILKPVFPTIRDLFLRLGLVKHNRRQPFYLGWLRAGQTRQNLKTLLSQAGFEDNYFGWIDPEEVLNMRKVVDIIYQYHVRLYKDGEVKGHLEYTTESRPIKHILEIGMVEGFDYLKPLLRELLSDENRVPDAKPDPTPPQPHF